MAHCNECGGSGYLVKVKLPKGNTVYVAGNNSFDKDSGVERLGRIKCGNCGGSGKSSYQREV